MRKSLDSDYIINVITTKEGYSLSQLQKKDRSEEVVDVRHLLLTMLKRYTLLSYNRVAMILNRSRITAIYAVKRTKNPYMFDLRKKYKYYDNFFKREMKYKCPKCGYRMMPFFNKKFCTNCGYQK